MAANYWASTQRLFWQFSRQKLGELRQAQEEQERPLISQYPLPERRHLSIFFNQRRISRLGLGNWSNWNLELAKLGRRMNVRQQALAAAQVYIRRFYLRVEIRRTNPYLVVATALYLACKMEECPQHIKVVVSEARSLWPDFIQPDISKLGECEFRLISEMNCQLIVHHPYRTLLELQPALKFAPDEASLAWSVVNDHYLTDLPLLHPLHVVAATGLFLALALKPGQAGAPAAGPSAAALAGAVAAARDGSAAGLAADPAKTSTPQGRIQHMIKWLAEGEIDIIAMVDCTQEIISLYEVWEQYNDKTCKEQIARFVKARNLDK